MQHQAALTERFMQQGWKPATHARYTVPVPNDEFMRCWGSSEPSRTGGLDLERSDCVMDTRIFVGDYTTGAIGVRHEAYDGSKLGPLRFAARYSASFRNESFGRLGSEFQTKPQCHEDFVDRAGLPLRAVTCLRAYKKFPGLYDLSVLVVTLDQPTAGVEGRFDVQGLSFRERAESSPSTTWRPTDGHARTARGPRPGRAARASRCRCRAGRCGSGARSTTTWC